MRQGRRSRSASAIAIAIAIAKPKHFAAIIKPSEVGALLRAIDGPDRLPVRRMAMRLSPHVLLRPGELRQAQWCDIDLEDRVWSVPAERMKMRRPHRCAYPVR